MTKRPLNIIVNNVFSHLVMDGLALIEDGEKIDARWEARLKKGGSATMDFRASEAYNSRLKAWKKKATKSLIDEGFMDEVKK